MTLPKSFRRGSFSLYVLLLNKARVKGSIAARFVGLKLARHRKCDRASIIVVFCQHALMSADTMEDR